MYVNILTIQFNIQIMINDTAGYWISIIYIDQYISMLIMFGGSWTDVNGMEEEAFI